CLLCRGPDRVSVRAHIIPKCQFFRRHPVPLKPFLSRPRRFPIQPHIQTTLVQQQQQQQQQYPQPQQQQQQQATDSVPAWLFGPPPSLVPPPNIDSAVAQYITSTFHHMFMTYMPTFLDQAVDRIMTKKTTQP